MDFDIHGFSLIICTHVPGINVHPISGWVIFIFVECWLEPKNWNMLGKWSTTEIHPWSPFLLFWDRVSLSFLGRSLDHSGAQTGFELVSSPVLVFWKVVLTGLYHQAGLNNILLHGHILLTLSTTDGLLLTIFPLPCGALELQDLAVGPHNRSSNPSSTIPYLCDGGQMAHLLWTSVFLNTEWH